MVPPAWFHCTVPLKGPIFHNRKYRTQLNYYMIATRETIISTHRKYIHIYRERGTNAMISVYIVVVPTGTTMRKS